MKLRLTKLLSAFRAVVWRVRRWRNRNYPFAAQTTTAPVEPLVELTYQTITEAISKLPPTQRVKSIVIGAELMLAFEKFATSRYPPQSPNRGLHQFMGIELYERPELFPEGGDILGAIYYEDKLATPIVRRKGT